MKTLTLCIIAGVCFYIPMAAQNSVVSHTINESGAQKVMDAAISYAHAHNAPGGSIAIVDGGGLLIAFHRLDNSFPASSGVAIEKAKTAALFRAESKKLEDAVNGGRVALTTAGYTFLQGGVPIIENGSIIGAIGVSGAMSADQDREIASAGADALIMKK